MSAFIYFTMVFIITMLFSILHKENADERFNRFVLAGIISTIFYIIMYIL